MTKAELCFILAQYDDDTQIAIRHPDSRSTYYNFEVVEYKEHVELVAE